MARLHHAVLHHRVQRRAVQFQGFVALDPHAQRLRRVEARGFRDQLGQPTVGDPDIEQTVGRTQDLGHAAALASELGRSVERSAHVGACIGLPAFGVFRIAFAQASNPAVQVHFGEAQRRLPLRHLTFHLKRRRARQGAAGHARAELGERQTAVGQSQMQTEVLHRRQCGCAEIQLLQIHAHVGVHLAQGWYIEALVGQHPVRAARRLVGAHGGREVGQREAGAPEFAGEPGWLCVRPELQLGGERAAAHCGAVALHRPGRALARHAGAEFEGRRVGQGDAQRRGAGLQ